jgi:hypothetical protein
VFIGEYDSLGGRRMRTRIEGFDFSTKPVIFLLGVAAGIILCIIEQLIIKGVL